MFVWFLFFTFMRQKNKTKKNWLVKSYCGRWIFKSTCHSGWWSKKLTSGPVCAYMFVSHSGEAVDRKYTACHPKTHLFISLQQQSNNHNEKYLPSLRCKSVQDRYITCNLNLHYNIWTREWMDSNPKIFYQFDWQSMRIFETAILFLFFAL